MLSYFITFGSSAYFLVVNDVVSTITTHSISTLPLIIVRQFIIIFMIGALLQLALERFYYIIGLFDEYLPIFFNLFYHSALESLVYLCLLISLVLKIPTYAYIYLHFL